MMIGGTLAVCDTAGSVRMCDGWGWRLLCSGVIMCGRGWRTESLLGLDGAGEVT